MAEYVLRVNGRAYPVTGEPGDSLLSILRYELGLSGSKFGCGEGYCGACTVLVDDVPTRACVARLGAVAGMAITTIESVGAPDKLHAVQQAFLDAEAFQCGYCTPGMVMATIGLLRANPDPSADDIARLMDRNVCRCGTFPRIVQAIKHAAATVKAEGGR